MENVIEKIEYLTRDELLYILDSLHKDTIKQFPDLRKFFALEGLKDINLSFSKKDANQIREELIFLVQSNSDFSKKIEETLNKKKNSDDNLVIASDLISPELLMAGTYLVSLIIKKVSLYLENRQISKNPSVEFTSDKKGNNKLIIRNNVSPTKGDVDLSKILGLIHSQKEPAEIIKMIGKTIEKNE